jgi:hypothetical protein
MQNPQLYSIVSLFQHLSFEERLEALQVLIKDLQKPVKKQKSLLSLAGTAIGLYGDIDAFIENERNWE